jgi:hypothetical protein
MIVVILVMSISCIDFFLLLIMSWRGRRISWRNQIRLGQVAGQGVAVAEQPDGCLFRAESLCKVNFVIGRYFCQIVVAPNAVHDLSTVFMR